MGMVRRTVTVALLCVGIGLGAAPLAWAAPTMGLKPSSGPAGSAFTISWSGFTQCRVISFTWAGAPLVNGSPGTAGSVGATVPADAKPGVYEVGAVCGKETSGSRFVVTGSTPTSTTPPPTTTTTTPPPTTTAVLTTKPPATTTTTPVTITTPPTTSSTTPSTSTPPSITDVPEPTGGGLVLDHGSVQPGQPLSASGTGCTPGHAVILTAEGEQVGNAVADDAGRFTAPVEFSRIQAGRHTITADCGVRLTGVVDQVITSSSGESSSTLVILVFFVLAGGLLIRYL
ncbi:putative secreted protein [Kutzneria albida DSM 43870]|uniref:Putative secreted protein n=2 Tax=Kutzneria TaxID=43356 RepID=W5W6V5_9PSEU|nr:putative secreted protein [Kutzneria albida DSM 43870]